MRSMIRVSMAEPRSMLTPQIRSDGKPLWPSAPPASSASRQHCGMGDPVRQAARIQNILVGLAVRGLWYADFALNEYASYMFTLLSGSRRDPRVQRECSGSIGLWFASARTFVFHCSAVKTLRGRGRELNPGWENHNLPC